MEQPLPKHGACNLGSINLVPFIVNPFTSTATFDYVRFAEAIQIAVRALDTVLDENLNNHALPEQRAMAEKFRNIGLGIIGLGDALIMLGFRYGSAESVSFCSGLMRFMFSAAVKASIELAKEKGAFPGYSDNVWEADIIKKNVDPSIIEVGMKYGLRNCSLLSIAPGGSIANLLGVSNGMEPEFALSYYRTTKSLDGEKDTVYKVDVPIVEYYREVTKNTGNLPDYFITAADLNWKERINVQAALQDACDTGISSTVNLPEDISLSDMEQLYLYAWTKGLKGITVFRSGCKRTAILTTKKEDPLRESAKKLVDTMWEEKQKHLVTEPKNRVGKIRTLTTGCGTLHLTCFFDKYTGQLVETFFVKGSTGGCNNYMNGLSRMISLSAKKGATVNEIVDQLNSTGACPSFVRRTALQHDTSKGSCCAMAAGYAIKEMYDEMQQELGDCLGTTPKPKEEFIEEPKSGYPTCPECGASVQMVEGCVSCPNCGYSKCG